MANETGNLDARLRGCYGSKVTPYRVRDWVKNNLVQNIEREDNGSPKIALNIWGLPGLGKTSIIKQLKKETVPFKVKDEEGKTVTKDMNIQIVDIPLAQIEEMGDVLGYPVEEIQVSRDGQTRWVKAVDSIIKTHLEQGFELTGAKRTTYAPPSWVPTKECPGVILFDDGNRASQRIMKGLMQLVQDYRTISWDLPRGWTIVFTGNPDNRYNQVTTMDVAQLTRMKHITLQFDKRQWAEWAMVEGLDKRGINFVLKNPEYVIGEERTNPRTLSEFFRALKFYPSLFTAGENGKKAFDQDVYASLMTEAESCLDNSTCQQITNFLLNENDDVIEPQDIFDHIEESIKKYDDLVDKDRIDIASVANDRLVLYLKDPKYKNEKHHHEAFIRWILAVYKRTPSKAYETMTFLVDQKDYENVKMKFWYKDFKGVESEITNDKRAFITSLAGDERICKIVNESLHPSID